MDQAELVRRCQDGDELAWEVLVRQHQSRLCGLAYSYVNNVEEARDLAQDIFVRLYERLASCTDPDRFLAWMIRLARNVCIDHLRRRKVRPPWQDIPAEDLVSLAAAGPDPEQEWTRTSRKELLYRAIRSLSQINGEIILLKDIQGLTLEEIAEILDVPLGTVKSRSSRARVELAKALVALGGGPAEATS